LDRGNTLILNNIIYRPMITNNNLKDLFEALNEKDIDTVFESDLDFILMELHTFNSGGYVTIKPHYYDESVAQEAADNGNLFVDKDDFLMLYQESGATNEFLELRT
jgi:hypothetical protein